MSAHEFRLNSIGSRPVRAKRNHGFKISFDRGLQFFTAAVGDPPLNPIGEHGQRDVRRQDAALGHFKPKGDRGMSELRFDGKTAICLDKTNGVPDALDRCGRIDISPRR
jgi:hypothetical protein